MELQELKNRWTSVDERLKKQEVLNTRIVEEMLKNKSKGALSKLINMYILCVAVAIIAIPIFVTSIFPFSGFSFGFALMVVAIVVCLSSGIESCFILRKYLMKIDFVKNIKDNMLLINKYNALAQKHKKNAYFIVYPVTFLLLALVYYEVGAFTHLVGWIVFISALLGAAVWMIWVTKFTDKNIQAVKEGLVELSELEE